MEMNNIHMNKASIIHYFHAMPNPKVHTQYCKCHIILQMKINGGLFNNPLGKNESSPNNNNATR